MHQLMKKFYIKNSMKVASMKNTFYANFDIISLKGEN